MTPYPYGPPPWWWNGGKAAAGKAAQDAIAESERLRKAGRLQVEKRKPTTAEQAIDTGLWEAKQDAQSS